jgi:hypothetical protein
MSLIGAKPGLRASLAGSDHPFKSKPAAGFRNESGPLTID